ncbi:MAG: hypothetical protein AMJ38_05525 [Dehalococcoidia bacterium DG_22]|nr:MAG: hypothetical protein AMJ38_05525 [Dehalococcoidia bacterium DG_22]
MRNKNLAIVAILLAVLTILALPWAASGMIAGPPVGPDDVGEAQGEVISAAIESPEVWFEDFGTGQLVNGQATVTIESIFLETINTDEPYHVFVTPLGDCSGLYVTNKTATSFEVRELGGGTSNVEFDYRIAAKRLEQPEPPVEEGEMSGAPPRSPAPEEESGQSEDVDLGRNLTPAEVEPGPGEDL